jgi:hypothetical protein
MKQACCVMPSAFAAGASALEWTIYQLGAIGVSAGSAGLWAMKQACAAALRALSACSNSFLSLTRTAVAPACISVLVLVFTWRFFCKKGQQPPQQPERNHSFIMYHGTSAAAAKAIKQSGFRPSITGGMLGKGVYLSRDIQKARAYSNGIDGKILRCRVKTGKVKKIDKQGHPLQKGWQDTYDSAWVPPHCGMVPSGLTETCVADPSRITVLGCTT